MILFGQSAGAFSVDMYTYAYPYDPLVRGFIAQSGLADSSTRTFDPSGRNFTYVASQVGCDASASADDILSCMQSAPASSIIEVYNKYNASQNNGATLSFGPIPDDETVFSNYTDRQARGLFARLPMIISQTNNEGSSLLPYSPSGPAGGQAAVDQFTRGIATCPASRGALARKNWNVPVWRVRYFGEWPNLNPFDWLGAYHSSDIPMIFGTSDLRGPDTDEEKATSKYYQNAWLAFARDPESGLKDYGWPTYDPSGETLIKLGNGSVNAVFTEGDAFDEGC